MGRREARLDRDIAALLAGMAFIEIRYLAVDLRRRSEDDCADGDLGLDQVLGESVSPHAGNRPRGSVAAVAQRNLPQQS